MTVQCFGTVFGPTTFVCDLESERSTKWPNYSLVHSKDTNSSVRLVDGSFVAMAGAANPGGSNTQIQFNNGGALGGDPNLIWDTATDTLRVAGAGNKELTATSGQVILTSSDMQIDSKAGTAKIGDINTGGHGSLLEVDDSGRQITANVPINSSFGSPANLTISGTGTVPAGYGVIYPRTLTLAAGASYTLGSGAILELI